MKRSSLYLLVLVVAAPLCAEILNGSTPITALASPLSWVFIILPYSLLIIILGYFVSRVRQPNSVLFLLPIAGLVIEGLITRSFFNPAFAQLSVLGGVGMTFGVQWPWTISLLASHMMTSFLLPLAIAGYCVPNEEVSARAAHISLVGLVLLFIAILFIVPANFVHFSVYIVATIVVIFFLVFLSRRIALPSSEKKSLSATMFFTLGFLFAPANWFSSFFLATVPVGWILAAQAFFLCIYIYFLWSAWWSPETTSRKRITFVIGYFIPYLIIFSLIGLHVLR